MKFLSAATLLAAAASAAPAPIPQAGTSFPLAIKGKVIAPGTRIDGKYIHANDLQFWIGKPTKTSCPENDPSRKEMCKKANKDETIFSYLNSSSKLGLLTMSPAGQSVYVTLGDAKTGQPAGQLKFTQARGSQIVGVPLYEGFANVYDARLQFEKKDWFACAVDNSNTAYTIWAQSRVQGTHPGAGCIRFTWHVDQQSPNVNKAWEYA